MKEKPDRPIYKDYIFRPAACLLATHVIILMGKPNISTFEAFEEPTYYPTLIINFAIALIVAWTVKKITVALDKRHPWYNDIWRRAMLQFAFGVLAVSILSYLLVLIYFVSFNQDIGKSGYLDRELPFSIALITILNFYYVASYFYIYPRQTLVDLNPNEPLTQIKDSGNYKEANDLTLEQPLNIQNEIVPENSALPVSDFEAADQEIPEVGITMKNREILIIDTHKKSIPIKVADVIMFFIIDSTVFIRMKGINNLNDCYQFDMYLTDIMDLICAQSFFRLNRKCIVNFEAIGSFTQLSERKILIALKAEHAEFGGIDIDVWNKLFEAFGEKVSEFKTWMNR